MTDDFRSTARDVADWIVQYTETVGERSIVGDVEPGEVRARVSQSPPEQGESLQRIFADFQSDILDGMTHWNHPGWFAYFPANNSPPSVLAEAVVAAMGAQCMSWQTSPAATELEQATMDWLAQMLGLSDEFVGVIQDTASSSTLVALISARERIAPEGAGVPDDLVVYASAEAHSSVDKAVRLAGIGIDNLRKIPVDPTTFAIDPTKLATTMQADVEAGLRPTCVIATVGTTSAGGVDPVSDVAAVCEAHGAWLHVDAAYAGSAAILDEKRWILDGVDRADSFNFNPHKWLMTNFDCSAYYVRDPEHLVHTFSTTPEYLRTAWDDQVVNFRDWGIPLGRRFRALKLWFVIRAYGVAGLQEMLSRHIEMARWFARRVADHPRLRVVGPTHFGLVCLRVDDDLPGEELDAATARLHRAINDDPRQYVTHTRLNERYTIRVSIGQWQTQRSHVEHLWKTIETALNETT